MQELMLFLIDKFSHQLKMEPGRRGAKHTAIRRVIENDDIPLSQDWNSFLSEPQNKAELALYLSHKLMDFAQRKSVLSLAVVWHKLRR